MFEKLSWFFVDKAYAQGAQDKFFGIFSLDKVLGLSSNSPSAQSTFSGVLTKVMGWVLAVVAGIAFVYLIISGVNYITAGGDAEKATKARTGILNAIIGIVVIMLAYFILTFAATLGKNIGGAGNTVPGF